MEYTGWLRQTKDKPAFPDVLWSRPENRRHAGKLMIAGGHAQSFSAPSKAFSAASKAGAGSVRIVLPDSLQKTVGKSFPEAEFALSTPIGSFSRKSLEPFLSLAAWSDSVLFAGDFGKNSETAILLDDFIDRYTDKLNISGDALDYFVSQPEKLLARQNTIIIATFSQLQRLVGPGLVLKQTANLAQIINELTKLPPSSPVYLVTEHSGQIIVAGGGKVSTTPLDFSSNIAAYVSVWAMQQPDKIFEALTTAIYCLTFE